MAIRTERLFPTEVLAGTGSDSLPLIVGVNPWSSATADATYVELMRDEIDGMPDPYPPGLRADNVRAKLPPPVVAPHADAVGLRLCFRAEVREFIHPEDFPPSLQIQFRRDPTIFGTHMYLAPGDAFDPLYPWYPLEDDLGNVDYLLDITQYDDVGSGTNHVPLSDWLNWLYAGQVELGVEAFAYHDETSSGVKQVTRIPAMWVEIDWEVTKTLADPRRLHPRGDGLGLGQGRTFPPPTSEQLSGRRAGGYI